MSMHCIHWSCTMLYETNVTTRDTYLSYEEKVSSERYVSFGLQKKIRNPGQKIRIHFQKDTYLELPILPLRSIRIHLYYRPVTYSLYERYVSWARLRALFIMWLLNISPSGTPSHVSNRPAPYISSTLKRHCIELPGEKSRMFRLILPVSWDSECSGFPVGGPPRLFYTVPL